MQVHDVERVRAVASGALGGRCALVADRSWPYGEALVLELLAPGGRRVIAKAHRQAVKFRDELAAYTTWVPALHPQAPEVLAHDEAARVLVLTFLPGTAAPRHDPEVHRQAGALLARFHAAAPAVRLPGHAQALEERLELWLARDHAGVVPAPVVAGVRARLRETGARPDPDGVPCHRDWQARNWLVVGGSVCAIDFEHARVGPWYADLHRLRWDEWRRAPELEAAFFEGYGRRPDDDEVGALDALSALEHLVTTIWAREHGDAAYEAHARSCLEVLVGA